MTYRELIAQLQKLTDEQLGCDVTVYDAEIDEYFLSGDSEVQVYQGGSGGILDDQHPFLIIKQYDEDECKESGDHLENCDADGYCIYCGHQ